MSSDSRTSVVERERLLSAFLAAVKSCQVRYGGRTELATESDSRVETLCSCLEEVLSHGLKVQNNTKSIAAIRQVTELVNNGLNLHLTLPGSEPGNTVLWWYIRTQLTRHEYERFLLLKNVCTDHGRGRAWIRSLLNEHSLERYMHIIVSDFELLNEWYEPSALLRDQERAAVLPNLAAGLDSILFAINIDNKNLDEGSAVQRESSEGECTESVAAVEPPKLVTDPVGPKLGKKKDLKKKRRKVPSQLVSFDEDVLSPDTLPTDSSPLYHSAPTTCLNSPALTTAASPYSDKFGSPSKRNTSKNFVNAQQFDQSKREEMSVRKKVRDSNKYSSGPNEIESSQKSISPLEEFDYNRALEDLLALQDENSSKSLINSALISDSKHKFNFNSSNTNVSGLMGFANEQEVGSYKSNISNFSGGSFQSNESGMTIPHPPTNSSLIPVSPRGIVDLGLAAVGDSVSCHSSSQNDEDCLSSSQSFREDADSTTNTTSVSSLTVDELRTAVLQISRSRDAAEGRKEEISKALTEEMDTSSTLRAQLVHERAQQEEQLEKQEIKISALTRENELLRHQLKKYVGAVQLLRRDGANLALQGELGQTKPTIDFRDYHDEAEAYESKLIQVAEMHGELMEFNERLQQHLRVREVQVKRLKEELVSLRGPLPDDQTDEGVDEDSGGASDTEDGGPPRVLINVWIPTAFLSGSSSDTHHVYQVYVRIKDDEWNIYRRYAQFYELHKLLRKKDAVIKTFDFPQKKTFGYKDVGVVEERRIMLQQYLRSVLNRLVSTNPQLSSHPSKASLTSLLSFLSDTPNGGSDQMTTRKLVASPGADTSSVPQYNGL